MLIKIGTFPAICYSSILCSDKQFAVEYAFLVSYPNNFYKNFFIPQTKSLPPQSVTFLMTAPLRETSESNPVTFVLLIFLESHSLRWELSKLARYASRASSAPCPGYQQCLPTRIFMNNVNWNFPECIICISIHFIYFGSSLVYFASVG